MRTTLNAEEILACLAQLLETTIHYHEAHPTHPLLPRVAYRIEENNLNAIAFNGKVVKVSYHNQTFGYPETSFYGSPRDVNASTKRKLELKPIAAVKRQLAKFVGCTFESVAEFKAVLLDEDEQDAPGAQVVSAAGIMDAINKNNFVALGAANLPENSGIQVSKVESGIKKMSAKNGVLTIQKGYGLVGELDCFRLRDELEDEDEYDENNYYEFQDLVPNAEVRLLLREAGFAGTWCAQFEREYERLLEILFKQARRDKLRALVA